MDKQKEYVSIKFLLKQVYAAHTAAVKDLEVEVADLKQQLKDAQLSVVSSKQTCEKCKQLESAFLACKEEYRNAVLEQSRRLKDLDHMFPAGNKKRKDNAPIAKGNLQIEEPCDDIINETLIESPIEDKDQKISLKYRPNPDTQFGTLDDTPSVNLQYRVNDRLLLEPDLEGSIAEVDNIVLVPDSLDVLPCDNLISSVKKLKKINEISISSGEIQGKENRLSSGIGNNASPRMFQTKKRALSELKVNEVELSNKRPNHIKTSVLTLKKQDDNSTGGKNVSVTPSDKAVHSQAQVVTRTKSLIDANIPWAENFKDFEADLAKKLKSNPTKEEIKILDESDDDFQINATEDNSTWKTSDKKKEAKKLKLLKAIKSSSKFKLTLDAPKPGDKKNYKQTKLSNSLFLLKKNVNENDCGNSNDSNSRELSTMMDASKLTALADGDATYFSFSGQMPPSSVTINASEVSCAFELVTHCKAVDKTVQSTVSNQQLPTAEEIVITDNEADEEDINSNTDFDKNSTEPNSFDRIPVPKELKYKYKEESTKNKLKRKQLNAFDCKECEKYYSELGLSSEERKERMKGCSRHRAKYAPPATPEHFWEIDFPSTEECKARGYVAETQKVKLKSRRRRPLNSDGQPV